MEAFAEWLPSRPALVDLSVARRRLNLSCNPDIKINPTVPNYSSQLCEGGTSTRQAQLLEVLSGKLEVCGGGRSIKEVGVGDL